METVDPSDFEPTDAIADCFVARDSRGALDRAVRAAQADTSEVADCSTLAGRLAAWRRAPGRFDSAITVGYHVAPRAYRDVVALVGLVRSPERERLLAHIGDGVWIVGPPRPAGVYLFSSLAYATFGARHWRFDADVWRVDVDGLATAPDPYHQVHAIGNPNDARDASVSFRTVASVPSGRLKLEVAYEDGLVRRPGSATEHRPLVPADVDAAIGALAPEARARAQDALAAASHALCT